MFRTSCSGRQAVEQLDSPKLGRVPTDPCQQNGRHLTRRHETESRQGEESQTVYDRYHVSAPGGFLWGGVLANFTPGHQDTYVNFKNEDRAPLLFIARGDDNPVPPSVNESNAHHYRHTKAITDYQEFPGRSHYIVGQGGWEEVADFALEWAVKHAS